MVTSLGYRLRKVTSQREEENLIKNSASWPAPHDGQSLDRKPVRTLHSSLAFYFTGPLMLTKKKVLEHLSAAPERCYTSQNWIWSKLKLIWTISGEPTEVLWIRKVGDQLAPGQSSLHSTLSLLGSEGEVWIVEWQALYTPSSAFPGWRAWTKQLDFYMRATEKRLQARCALPIYRGALVNSIFVFREMGKDWRQDASRQLRGALCCQHSPHRQLREAAAR